MPGAWLPVAEFQIDVTLTHDGKPYDTANFIGTNALEAIEEARHWLGNVIDNDDALANQTCGVGGCTERVHDVDIPHSWDGP